EESCATILPVVHLPDPIHRIASPTRQVSWGYRGSLSRRERRKPPHDDRVKGHSSRLASSRPLSLGYSAGSPLRSSPDHADIGCTGSSDRRPLRKIPGFPPVPFAAHSGHARARLRWALGTETGQEPRRSLSA